MVFRTMLKDHRLIMSYLYHLFCFLNLNETNKLVFLDASFATVWKRHVKLQMYLFLPVLQVFFQQQFFQQLLT